MTVVRAIVLVSLGAGAVIGPAAAEEKWVLWGRPLDDTGEQQGDWSRGPVFESERWCKGAMTYAINQTLSKNQAQSKTQKNRSGGNLAEYQCLPESADPRTTKGKQ